MISSYRVNAGCTLSLVNQLGWASGFFNIVQISFSPLGDCFATAYSGSNGFKSGLVTYSVASNSTIAQLQAFAPAPTQSGTGAVWSPLGTCVFFATSNNIFSYSTALPPKPSITSSSTLVCEGGSFTLTASPAGLANYTFTTPQGSVDQGVNNMLTISNATLADQGSYSVQVTNQAGCINISDSLQITVDSFTATLSPADQSLCQGGTISLTAGPAGEADYLFHTPSTSIDNGTNNVLVITNATTTDAGSYSVQITDTYGCVQTSNEVTVEVENIDVMLSPETQQVCEGGTITLTASPAGESNYLFHTPTGDINNGTNNILTINNATGLNAGSYSVQVTSQNGCVFTSNSVTVEVENIDVTLSPETQQVCEGGTITLTASPAGESNYLFHTPTGDIDNGTNNILTINNATSLNAGSYSAQVTSQNGCVFTSNSVTVNVAPCKLALSLCCQKQTKSTLSFTVTVKNPVNSPAFNVVVTDLLPAGTTFTGVTGDSNPWNFQVVGNTVTATLPVLNANSIASFTITAELSSPCSKILTNIVTATASNFQSTTGNCKICCN